MKNKRGTDHNWNLIKYNGDAAIYAECQCGHYYCCSVEPRDEDGSWTFKQVPTFFYPYCPCCGARKKYFSKTIEKSTKYSFERTKHGRVLDMSYAFE